MLYLLLITTIFSSDSAETMKKKRFHLETKNKCKFHNFNWNDQMHEKEVVSSAEHA